MHKLRATPEYYKHLLILFTIYRVALAVVNIAKLKFYKVICIAPYNNERDFSSPAVPDLSSCQQVLHQA